MAAPPPPPLPDELVEEILLRLPTDDPACLLRSSLVCKDWGDIVSRPTFRRRLHEHHRAPPLLGFLQVQAEASERTPCFIPTTASSFSLAAAPDHRSWLPLDCRHGRALFISECEDELLVWEPITRARQQVPVPAAFVSGCWTAAVFCAAEGCDHRDCHGGPFRVLFLFSPTKEDTDDDDEEDVMSACVYSSESGAWGELNSLSLHSEVITSIFFLSVLVGSSLLYFIFHDKEEFGWILEYDLSRHSLTLLGGPDKRCDCLYNAELPEDSGLGVIQALGPHLKLWTRDAVDDIDARWVLSRVIDLHNLLPTSARLNEGYGVRVLGFAEGPNVISVDTLADLFTIELQSDQASKVCDHRHFLNLVPVITFYTLVPRRNHQSLLVPKPCEEKGGDEGGEDEKTVNQAQQQFESGSNAIKEGDFVNTNESIRHDHTIRVLHHGEVALGFASMFKKYRCAYKARELNDSLDDVPKNASSEESVEGTAREDDAGDSNTSGSNVEVAAPSLEKGDSQEVPR